jgi:hypothetical protein
MEDQPDLVQRSNITGGPESDPTSTTHVIGVDPETLTVNEEWDYPSFAELQAAAELLPPKAHVMFERWCTKYGVELGPRISPANAEAAAQTIQMLRSE